MSKIKTGLTLVLIFITLVVFSQQKDSVKVHLNHYTLTVGTGWTYFFNNLENGDQDIKKNFIGVSFKFLWEPEYRLSLGLESGYYRLFKVTNQIGIDTSVTVTRTVVPMLLLVRMQIVDNVYLGAGMGLAFLNNKASGPYREVVTQGTSMSNFELFGSYIYPLRKHWLVGGEIKVFHFGSLSDWMYSIQATCAVKL